MLLVSFRPDRLIAQQVLDLGEQIVLLIVVMRLDETEPCLRIPNESGLVLSFNIRCLEVDAVVAANDGIMQQSHVSCAGGENVGLFPNQYPIIAARKLSYTHPICRILRRCDELHRPIGPQLGRRRRLHHEGRATQKVGKHTKEGLGENEGGDGY